MPKPTVIEWVKLYTGSTGAHLMWERKKKDASKVVVVSVFKDGLGPAIDALGKALVAEDAASRKATGELTRGPNGRYVSGPNYRAYAAASTKARDATKDKWARLDRVLIEYIKLCDAKKANPADKLTKPAGPTSAAEQAKVWAGLSDHLQKLRKSITERPQIARIDDKFVQRPDA